ncbi:hypothetical protein [Mycolicibacterium llatzerense]|uniref:hypothetical protein n=1 Tax=Mycolicibacterium llatzerense TaxID=280871 RepID=UPI0008DD5022|nr:hypothetical protein [Mycolicibacterium llatzerense]
MPAAVAAHYEEISIHYSAPLEATMSVLKFASAALLAAALTVTTAPVSIAAPSDDTWDIEAYDNCMKKTVRNADLCCIESGGIPGMDPETGCHAPPAKAADAPLTTTTTRPLPGGINRGNLPTMVLEPAN